MILLANHGDTIIDPMAMTIAGIADAAMASVAEADGDPALTRKHLAVIRDLSHGKYEPAEFTLAMQLFLPTATAQGMWQWIASHGELQSLTYRMTESIGGDSIRRYSGVTNDVQLSFSVRMTESWKIAQIVWW